MNTKNFFKTVAMAMLMPAVLLTASCSKGDDAVTNPEKPANTEAAETAVNKGYALPVTVNVTRQDNGTRATYTDNGNKTGRLDFSAGDKLFVNGRDNDGAGQFAGELTWQSGGTFSGTIYTKNQYSGTADALFSAATSIYATLLPNGYESTGFLYVHNNNTTEIYDDVPTVHETTAFVASGTAKATGVEQLSWERASTYNSGFALAPLCAVLNFTISGLEAGAPQNVTLWINKDMDYPVAGSVTPNASGVATFAIGVPNGANIRDTENNLTVGSSNFTLPSSTTFAAGKIYNITRGPIPGALNGQFSVSNTKKVYFSKGNLRYASGTWSFFDNQYDYYSTYSADAWDKFGWSTSKTTFGMSTSTTYEDYYGDFVDWGTVPGIGEGWYTLCSDEWLYIFGMETNGEDKSGHARYRMYFRATVNGVSGVVLLPDDISDISDIPTEENRGTASTFAGKIYTIDAWNALEAKGCVFLPAAGDRYGNSVRIYNDGYYWASNSEYSSSTDSNVYFVSFDKYGIHPSAMRGRFLGHSVRLVRQVK